MKYIVLIICCFIVIVGPIFYFYKQRQIERTSVLLQEDIHSLIGEWLEGERGKRNYAPSLINTLKENGEYLSGNYRLVSSDSLLGTWDFSYCFESGALLHLVVGGESEIEGLIQGGLYAPKDKEVLRVCGT